MSDLASVRAEIKTWEREFKAQNGHEPSVQDIRDNAPIAAKYKLYKKLGKAATAPSASSSKPSQPAVPDNSSLRATKPRAIESTAPLSSFNPFSPQKSKGKQKESTISVVESRSNPFLSPKKSKSNPTRDPSPDLFAPLQPNLVPNPSLRFSSPPSAVSRARKRLRGEPVSPSPQKRPRIASSQTLTTLLNPDPFSSDEEVDPAANSSFVDDSPVKNGGVSSFKLLFEDNAATKEGLLAKPTFSAVPLFDHKLRGASTSLDDDMDVDRPDTAKSKPKVNGKAAVNGKSLPHRVIPSKNNLYSVKDDPVKPVKGKDKSSEARVSLKRPFAGAEAPSTEPPITSQVLPLIPPSPPPLDSLPSRGNTQQYGKTKGKEKMVSTTSRKKGKTVDEGDEEDEDEEMNGPVKVVQRVHPHAKKDQDLDPDLILDYAGHAASPRGLHSANLQADVHDDGHVEVDLPDKLREVLALSASDLHARTVEDEMVVAGLVYGRREGHYDPQKGGEIWDVGEDVTDGGATVNIDTEDDWEGEAVPWEVGEL